MLASGFNSGMLFVLGTAFMGVGAMAVLIFKG